MADADNDELDWLAVERPERARNFKYTPELAAKVLQRMADGESLRSMCKDKDIPDRFTIWRWRNAYPNFAAAFAQAREYMADCYFEDCIAIADGVDDSPSADHQERRLRVDTRKWAAARLNNYYSDKTKHEHSGPDGGAIPFTAMEVTFVDPPVPGSS